METLISACSEFGIGISWIITAGLLLIVGLVTWTYLKVRGKKTSPHFPDPTPPKNKKRLFEFGFKVKFLLLELSFNYKSDSDETRNRGVGLQVPNTPNFGGQLGAPLFGREIGPVLPLLKPSFEYSRGEPYPILESSRTVLSISGSRIHRTALKPDPEGAKVVREIWYPEPINEPVWDIDTILRDVERKTGSLTGVIQE